MRITVRAIVSGMPIITINGTLKGMVRVTVKGMVRITAKGGEHYN